MPTKEEREIIAQVILSVLLTLKKMNIRHAEMAVWLAMTLAHGPVRVSDAANATGYSRTITRRYIHKLIKRGAVAKMEEDAEYYDISESKDLDEHRALEEWRSKSSPICRRLARTAAKPKTVNGKKFHSRY